MKATEIILAALFVGIALSFLFYKFAVTPIDELVPPAPTSVTEIPLD